MGLLKRLIQTIGGVCIGIPSWFTLSYAWRMLTRPLALMSLLDIFLGIVAIPVGLFLAAVAGFYLLSGLLGD